MAELTKTDLTALRKATNICFDHDKDDGGQIRAIKRPGWKAREKDPFLQDITYRIAVESNLNGRKKAFHMEHYTSEDRRWQTIVYFLKPGDDVSLKWDDGGHTNQYLADAGFKGDGLSLKITRKNKHFEFFISSRVCPKGNSAGMIRD